MRVTIDRQADVILTNLTLTGSANVDLSVSPGDIAFGNGTLAAELRRGFGTARPISAPTEGAIVPVTVTPIWTRSLSASAPIGTEALIPGPEKLRTT